MNLQENLLSKILDKEIIEVDHLGAVKRKLKALILLLLMIWVTKWYWILWWVEMNGLVLEAESLRLQKISRL